jgi:hypothetical protein
MHSTLLSTLVLSYSEDAADEYADDRNSSLALAGIPSSVACYSVVAD